MLTYNRAPLVCKAGVKLSIPGISNKLILSKTLTLAEMDTAWPKVSTDGSVENATQNGGVGIHFRQPNKPPITIATLD